MIDKDLSEEQPHWAESYPAKLSTNESDLLYQEALEEVEAVVAGDPLDKQILRHRAAGRNQDEIAVLMGVDAATVSRRLARMLQAWREQEATGLDSR